LNMSRNIIMLNHSHAEELLSVSRISTMAVVGVWRRHQLPQTAR
jgi:hypothetical protein